MSHSHGHGCDGDHDHDETPEMGVQYSLYSKIDVDNLECLNESEDGAGKTVFKPWEERLNLEKYVESDVDEELLFNIPFKNRPHMTFDDVALAPEQEFELHADDTGTLEYSTAVVKFSSVNHLTIHFPNNFGSEKTRIYYIGLRGEFSTAYRHGVTICSYETRPNVADHKIESINPVTHEIQ
ncbi:PITH domain-containing protein CG6153 isoform X3 [Lycorma delicatula]|uniref:PITH domain-containing protein CG6153 isoform X3 n=1 Tax=Lycorma delicatula TaxID=130591 RepID=UPI003F51A6CE